MLRTNVNSTGVYRCEVKLTDGTTQAEERKSVAVYLPLGGGYPELSIQPRLPILIPMREEPQIVIVSVDDFIEVNCTSKETNPESSLFVKINGVKLPPEELVDLRGGSNVSWEGIRGIPYHNKLITSVLTARIRMEESLARKGFTSVACSSVMTLAKHGFIHQQDSDAVSIRVVRRRPRVYVNEESERYKSWFYGFFAVTILCLFANHYWEKRQMRQAYEKDQKDAGYIIQCTSKSSLPSSRGLPYSSSEVDLCRLSFSAESGRRPKHDGNV